MSAPRGKSADSALSRSRSKGPRVNPDHKEGFIAAAKLGSVWAAVGITSWADLAAVLAALYSAMLIGEFIWKKVLKPYLEWRRGK
jgi:hypothetical protein